MDPADGIRSGFHGMDSPVLIRLGPISSRRDSGWTPQILLKYKLFLLCAPQSTQCFRYGPRSQANLFHRCLKGFASFHVHPEAEAIVMMLRATRSTASGLYSHVANSTSGSAYFVHLELRMDKAARTRHAASKFVFFGGPSAFSRTCFQRCCAILLMGMEGANLNFRESAWAHTVMACGTRAKSARSCKSANPGAAAPK